MSADDFNLAPVYGDRTVLQQGRPHVFWGSAASGKVVTVTANDIRVSTLSENCNWEIIFGPLPQGGPYHISISCENETIDLKDIYVGDVWLVAGQSNAKKREKTSMPLTCSFFTGYGPVNERFYPEESRKNMLLTQRKWVKAGQCSIFGSSFAKEMNAKTGAPIGIVDCAFAGTPIQLWYKGQKLHAVGKIFNWINKVFKLKRKKLFTLPDIGSTCRWITKLRFGTMASEWVYPLKRMPVRGVLWWQGESNLPFHAQYADHLYRLIKEWRWSRRDNSMPFVIVSIQEIASEKNEDLEAFRMAQQNGADAAGHCLVVQTTDLTFEGKLHPKPSELAAIGKRCAEEFLSYFPA